MSKELDRSMRSWTEKVEEEYEPKRFVITTFGACGSNTNEIVIEANKDRAMWEYGVGKITVGGKVAFFDLNELQNYLAVCLQ